MDVPKKYWWIAGIVVPIIIASITITPNLLREKGIIYVAGNQFTGKVAFNNITIVAEQARQILGKELPVDVLETLREALNLVQSRQFDKAIPLFQSTATAAPVPSVFNNLGAIYLATGNKEKAKEYFKKAPDEKTARFNLKRLTTERGQPETLTHPTVFAGVEATVKRFEKTDGMITLEVIFQNTSTESVRITRVYPDDSYLIDERTGSMLEVKYSGGLIGAGYSKELEPGDKYYIWIKCLIGEKVPKKFTAVVHSVPLPFEGLILK
jgi:tetratricopeptide (TPR) repeat protein